MKLQFSTEKNPISVIAHIDNESLIDSLKYSKETKNRHSAAS